MIFHVTLESPRAATNRKRWKTSKRQSPPGCGHQTKEPSRRCRLALHRWSSPCNGNARKYFRQRSRESLRPSRMGQGRSSRKPSRHEPIHTLHPLGQGTRYRYSLIRSAEMTVDEFLALL
jgi:hypothetical protein